jgi:hypothetical protein
MYLHLVESVEGGNRRIFENEYRTAQRVTSLTKKDIVQRHRAVAIAGEAN